MTTRELVMHKRGEIIALAEAHRAGRVRLYGSVVRGEDVPESDIDFLVEFTPEATLFDHIRLMRELEELLGRKVDVVSDKAVHWFIRDRVLAEAVAV
jgi:uncharacterized protein